MSKIKNLIGNTYGGLTVISLEGRDKWSGAFWKCLCVCGNYKNYSSGSLLSGNYKSCGCGKHRKERGKEELRCKEYRTWSHIKSRCHRPNHKSFKNYGAKGIFVCDRWRYSYDSFLCDMGRAPTPKHTIERIENSKGYEPFNCRWATMTEQAFNRCTTIKVGNMSLFEKCGRDVKFYHRTLFRLKRGWDLDKAINIPKLSHRYDVKKEWD